MIYSKRGFSFEKQKFVSPSATGHSFTKGFSTKKIKNLNNISLLNQKMGTSMLGKSHYMYYIPTFVSFWN